MADFTALRATVRAAESTLAQALYQKVSVPGMANQTAFSNAQQSLRAARSALNAALAAALPAGADAASNLRGDLPIALFPVRIETRFVRSAPTVRAGLGVRRATGATSLASISSGSVAAGPTTSAATVSRAPSTGSAVVRAGAARRFPPRPQLGFCKSASSLMNC